MFSTMSRTRRFSSLEDTAPPPVDFFLHPRLSGWFRKQIDPCIEDALKLQLDIGKPETADNAIGIEQYGEIEIRIRTRIAAGAGSKQ